MLIDNSKDVGFVKGTWDIAIEKWIGKHGFCKEFGDTHGYWDMNIQTYGFYSRAWEIQMLSWNIRPGIYRNSVIIADPKLVLICFSWPDKGFHFFLFLFFLFKPYNTLYWAYIGSILALSCSYIGPIWPFFDPSWTHFLAPFWPYIGLSNAYFVAILAHFRAFVATLIVIDQQYHFHQHQLPPPPQQQQQHNTNTNNRNSNTNNKNNNHNHNSSNSNSHSNSHSNNQQITPKAPTL